MPYYIRKKKSNSPKSSRSKLIQKLDRVFSKYIRLRDAMPSGYFQCISCGKIKPISQGDCGHYFSRTHMATRFDEDNCHAECRFCLTPDMRVYTLGTDRNLFYQYHKINGVKPLGEIREGDMIAGFREAVNYGLYTDESIVTHVHRDIQEVFDVELEHGHVQTTAGHKWVITDEQGDFKWASTEDFVKKYNLQVSVFRAFETFSDRVQIPPYGERSSKVLSVTPLGKQEIVVMETSTHTFFAEGYAMHNCNRFSADHLDGYRSNLARKIGIQRMDRLSVLAHSTKHWLDFELEELIDHYKEEVKRLSKEKGIKL